MESLREIFLETGESLSVMESVTGGLLSDAITSMPGVSSFFKGGLVAYQDEIKARFGVSDLLIRQYGAVSPQVAAEMAAASRKLFGSDWGISTTGVAGPDALAAPDGSPIKPGTVFIGLASNDASPVSRRFSFEGHRNQIREQTVVEALHWLKEVLRLPRNHH